MTEEELAQIVSAVQSALDLDFVTWTGFTVVNGIYVTVGVAAFVGVAGAIWNLARAIRDYTERQGQARAEDVKRYATHEDVERCETRLSEQLRVTQGDVRNLRDRVMKSHLSAGAE